MRPPVLAAFATLSFVWGSTYLFIKIGLQYWPPFLLAAGRNLLAALALLGVMGALGRRLPRTWRELWPPLAFGLINGTAFALIFWGQRYIPTSQTAVLVATVPFFTLLLARWWLGEPFTLQKLVAVGLGLAGVVLATGTREGAGFSGSGTQRLLGQMAMLGAAGCYAVSYVFSKKYFRGDTYSNTAGHLAASGLYLLTLSLLLDAPAGSGLTAPAALGALLYLALPGSALAYWCMFYLMENLTPLQATYPTLINPLVAVFLGVLFLGETVTAGALAGTLLVLAGAWLVNRARA